MGDAIDSADAQWAEVWPELDVSAGAVLGRIQRLSYLIDAAQVERLRRRPGRIIGNRGDLDLLRLLRRSGAPYRISPSEIVKSSLGSSAGLTGRLRRLEAEGWIERVPSESDARASLVQLTPAGLADLDSDLPDQQAFESSLLAALDPTTLKSAIVSLRALLESLETD